MGAMDGILSQINSLTANTPGSLTYYCCESCTATYGSNSGPKLKCDGCGSTGFQYPGSTREEALERRNKGYGQTNATEALLEVKPAPEPEILSAPIMEEVSKPARKVKPKVEVASVATVVASDVLPKTPDVLDFAAKRQALTQQFIEAHQLNEFQPVEVGTAVVQAVGFTLWQTDPLTGKKRPVFRIQESFEDAKDFAAAYSEARAAQPAVRIDVAACNRVSSPELEACLFKGDLTVSLNSGHGTTQVRRGDVVKIGAYKTKENKLRFAVI